MSNPMAENIDPQRLRDELKKMKQLIASDPRVLAHFDTDGNGVIDGEEWENVRQVVTRRLQREAAEAAAAQEYLDGLDAQQAAELARMEAEMAGDDEEPAGRDFSNVELAFDPREKLAQERDRSVADDIYERELAARLHGDHPARHRAPKVGEAGSLADCRVLVLEQVGGAKQLFGNMFRRAYLIRDENGEEVGRVGQRQNEAIQDLTDFRILSDPDLHFDVEDYGTGERYTFHRSSNFSDNSIDVYNPRKFTIAISSWTLSFLRRKYEVRSVREGISYYVRRRALRPWTYDVLNPFDESIGTMQRGWSGLGFLTAGNLFRIELDKDVDPDAMWGFLATALLADLDTESNSRRSGLDLFNN